MEQPTPEHPLRVLVVASRLTFQVVQQMLRGVPEIVVCGTASHGQEALAQLPGLHPHLVCLADHLPMMGSLELTQEIMSHYVCPILVLQGSSGFPLADAAPNSSVFELLQAGAVDVFLMSSIVPGPDSPQTRQLISKIKMVARVPVISRSSRGRSGLPGEKPSSRPSILERTAVEPRATPPARPTPSANRTPSENRTPPPHCASERVVAIGSSTGGPQALLAVLSKLPGNYPFPILCVQHISKGFIGGLVEWLDEQCQVKVKIARSGEVPVAGVVYFPEEGKHLELDETEGTIRLTLSPAVDGHRPSATVLFRSVARWGHQRAVAVLLTGMGSDGAPGLKAVHEAQGLTIAQNQESCVVFGMPAAAIEMGAAQHVLPLAGIADKLLALAKIHLS